MILSILNLIFFGMKPTQKLKKEDWIEKDWKNKIPKLDKKVIFIPSQKELNF